jgi:hypothetical protein
MSDQYGFNTLGYPDDPEYTGYFDNAVPHGSSGLRQLGNNNNYSNNTPEDEYGIKHDGMLSPRAGNRIKKTPSVNKEYVQIDSDIQERRAAEQQRRKQQQQQQQQQQQRRERNKKIGVMTFVTIGLLAVYAGILQQAQKMTPEKRSEDMINLNKYQEELEKARDMQECVDDKVSVTKEGYLWDSTVTDTINTCWVPFTSVDPVIGGLFGQDNIAKIKEEYKSDNIEKFGKNKKVEKYITKEQLDELSGLISRVQLEHEKAEKLKEEERLENMQVAKTNDLPKLHENIPTEQLKTTTGGTRRKRHRRRKTKKHHKSKQKKTTRRVRRKHKKRQTRRKS